jgi:hypothetical protein
MTYKFSCCLYTFWNCKQSSSSVMVNDKLLNHNFTSTARQSPVGQNLLIIGASQPHSDTPQSIGLPSTSDQPDAETSTRQQITLTSDSYPWPRRYSNPQSQQASGRKPTLWHGSHWDRLNIVYISVKLYKSNSIEVRSSLRSDHAIRKLRADL